MNVLLPAGPQAAHIAALWWLALALCALVFKTFAPLRWAIAAVESVELSSTTMSS